MGLDWQFDLVVSHALFSRKWRDPATDGAARRRRLRLLGKVHRRGQLRRRRIRPKSEKYVAMGLISDLDMSSTSDNSFAAAEKAAHLVSIDSATTPSGHGGGGRWRHRRQDPHGDMVVRQAPVCTTFLSYATLSASSKFKIVL